MTKRTLAAALAATAAAAAALAAPLASAYGPQTLLRGAQPAPAYGHAQYTPAARFHAQQLHHQQLHHQQIRGPVAYRAPAYRPVHQPVHQRVAQAPVYQAPVHRAPVRPAPVRPVPVRPAPAYGAPVHTFAPGTVYGANVGHAQPVYGVPRAERRPVHDNLLKVGAVRFFLQDESGQLEGTGDPINDLLTPADYRVDIENKTAFAGSYTRHIGDHFGIEVPLGLPVEFDIKGAGAAADVVEQVGTVKALPATVIGNFYFTPREATVRPYIGAAVNRTFYFSEEPDPGLEPAVLGDSTIEIEDSTGLGAFAGVNVRLSDRLHASVLAGYVDVSADAKIRTTTLPDLLGDNLIVDREIDVDLNPVVGLATVGFSF